MSSVGNGVHNFQTVFDRSEIEHVKIENSSARIENVIGSVRLRQAAELATLKIRVIETENVCISERS